MARVTSEAKVPAEQKRLETELGQVMSRLESMTDDRDRVRKELVVEQARTRAHNRVLDKLIDAASGWTLDDEPNRGAMGRAHMEPLMLGEGPRAMRLTPEERAEFETDRLRERVVSAESRLAAVVAVAQFAKSHKA